MDFTPVRQFMDDLVQTRSPGSVIRVCHGGEVVFSYACGFSDLETKTKMTGKEFFNIYSCTKIATVTAAMILVEQGRLSLDAPLSDYISEFSEMFVRCADGTVVPAKNPILIWHLFNMTAGFDYNLNSPSINSARQITGGRMDTLTVIRALAQEPLSFEPGSHWQYSLCHDVLAAVVEVVVGMSFAGYLRTALFDPLGMTGTTFDPKPDHLARMAQQYAFVPAGEKRDMDPVEAQKYGSDENGSLINVGKGVGFKLGACYESGGAGIVTTVDDYMKLLTMLTRKGTGLNGSQILKPETVELMRKNTLSPELLKDYNWQQLRGYGYGLGLRTMMDPAATEYKASAGEFGWCGAAGAFALCDPENDLTVFFLQHMLNPREEYYMPRLRDAIYSCF